MNNDYVYAIAGDDTTFSSTSSVVDAFINADGSLGSWTTTTALPAAMETPAVVNDGYVYAIGGFGKSSFGTTSTVSYAPFACTGDAITGNTVLVNSATFTRFQNTNSVLNKTVVSVQADITLSYNATGPEDQYSEEKVTTVALRN